MTASNTSPYAAATRSSAWWWIELAKRGGRSERRGEERVSVVERKWEKVDMEEVRTEGAAAGRWERGVCGGGGG